MTSRERVKKILEFRMPDRIGIADDFGESAVQKWRNEGSLPKDDSPQEYFDFDIRLFGFNQDFLPDSKNPITLERINNSAIGESLKEGYDDAQRKNKFLVLEIIVNPYKIFQPVS